MGFAELRTTTICCLQQMTLHHGCSQTAHAKTCAHNLNTEFSALHERLILK